MPKVKVYNMSAEVVGNQELAEAVFGVEYNQPLIHQVVVAQDANLRQGTKSTLTRSEVRGHAKKPFAQKHTGNARQGSTKGPQFRGGGIVFAPKPRDFSKKINKQMKKSALASALSQKLAQEDITVIDSFKFARGKTKFAQQFLDTFKFDKTVLVVLDKTTEATLRATSNLENLQVTTANLLNVSDVVKNRKLVLETNAVKIIEEGWAE
ncbi:MAG: 50S ribosomal protein L4 [Clostridia bacterium]